MQPDLRHIRALAAIKEHGSFRQAAQSLRISAPGLTKIIQALEHGLGVELVDRTTRPISLTKYGQAVCDQGTEALASIEQGFQQVEVMKGLEQVELVISTNAFFSVAIAAKAVSKLIPQHPGAHFQINSELPRDAAIHFEKRRSDFFIGTEGELNQNNNAQSITLPWPGINYIVREGHPLLSLLEIRLADCLAYPLLGPRPPTWWEEYFRDWALGIGVPLPTGYENTSPFHRAQSTDWATILTLCRACDGITGGSSSSGSNDLELLPDTDNDGIVNDHDHDHDHDHDFDIDGDGTLNEDDSDVDGDGISNPTPDDNDGDGIPNPDDSTPNTPNTPTDPTPAGGPGVTPPTPGLVCTSATMLPPKDAITGVRMTVSWDLLPAGCGVGVTSLVAVTASNPDGKITETSQFVGVGTLTADITIPHSCNWEAETKAITYDFSQIGDALGDTTGTYTTSRDADVGSHPHLCKKPPVLCTSVTFTAPQEAKFDSSYELTWRLSPEGCIPHNGNEKLMPMMWGFVQAPEVGLGDQLILDPVPGWPPLDGKATIDVPDSKFCTGDYDKDGTSDGKVGVLGFDDRSDCKLFRIGAVGKAGTCDGFRIPLLSCP